MRTHITIRLFFPQDLQSEIESHKDVVASLNATGQKLLGTLENQDEAMLLHRRLEEMNTRWNTLKHRSIAIRLVGPGCHSMPWYYHQHSLTVEPPQS